MKPLRAIELTFHVLIIVGYFYGLFPFGYLFTLWWVIPLTVANVVISLLCGGKNLSYNVLNVLMAVLSIIPFVGFIFRIVGIVLSAVAINELQGRKR